MSNAQTERRTAVFVSYSHADVKWLERLKVHLKPYGAELSVWDDRDLAPGDLWTAEILRAIESSRAAVLLLSPDFLASEYVTTVEIPHTLKVARRGGLRLLCLLLAPSALDRSGLSSFQFLNDPKCPLSSFGLNSADAEALLASAAEQIASALDTGNKRAQWLGTRVNHEATLPGLLAAATFGRMNFVLARRFRTEIADELRRSGVTESVIGNALQVRERELHVDTPFDDANVCIVSGPAGVGKSTFVNDLLRSQGHRFDLVIVLRGGRLSAASQEEANGRIAAEIENYRLELQPLSKHRRLSASGIAYILRSRRVLIIAEDVHQGGSAAEAVLHLQRFLMQHHAWSERVRILVTTREREDDSGSLFPRGARVISLQPLPQQQAQMLFYDLCKTNDVPEEVLLANGEHLGNAFGTESVRTPLFITICALLASPHGQRLELRRILEMTAAEIFEVFVDHLLQRSGAPESDFHRLRTAYCQLAFDMWPEWENCRATTMVERLALIDPLSDGVGLLGFFERGGFLSRPWYQRTRVNFPHHAMADYLAATSMTERQEYAKLAHASAGGRLDGVVQFLETAVMSDDALKEIASANLQAAVRVASARALRDRSRIPVESFVPIMAMWATSTRCERQSPEAWVALRDAVSGRVTDDWMSGLVTAIESIGPVQAHGIESLTMLDRPVLRNALRRWLATGYSHDSFEAAASSDPVAAFLVDVLRSYPSRDARAAFGLLCTHPSPNARAAIAAVLRDHALDLSADEIRLLSAAGKSALRLIGEALRDHAIQVKRSLSERVFLSIGRALVPCGEYLVNDGGKSVSIRINRPLLVPLRNDVLQGRFSGVDSYREAIKRRIPKDKTVMTKYQALVALQHFSVVAPGPGIQFSRPDEDLPEVFWDPETRNPAAYVVPETRATAVMKFSPPVEPTVRSRIALRAVEAL